MSVPFAATVTPDSIIFTAPDGKTHTVATDHPGFAEVKDLVRRIGARVMQQRLGAGKADALSDPAPLMARLLGLVAPTPSASLPGKSRVSVRLGVVYHGDTPLHSMLAERILWGLREGFEMAPYLHFLENLLRNPSKRVVDHLFSFIERHKLAITEDGHILGYTRVLADGRDVPTGRLDHTPGQIIALARNQVSDDPFDTGASGLQFCSQSCLCHAAYGGATGTTILIVKVDPADVVSLPLPDTGVLLRCCRYQVIERYQELQPALSTRIAGAALPDPPQRDFAIGDMVLCVDAVDLGVTDIAQGFTYRVDGVQENGQRIWIGVEQGIGRSYDAARFILTDQYNPDDGFAGEDDAGHLYGEEAEPPYEIFDPALGLSFPEDAEDAEDADHPGWLATEPGESGAVLARRFDGESNLAYDQTGRALETMAPADREGDLAEQAPPAIPEASASPPPPADFEPATWVTPANPTSAWSVPNLAPIDSAPTEPSAMIEPPEQSVDSPDLWIEEVPTTPEDASQIAAPEGPGDQWAVPMSLPLAEIRLPPAAPMHDPVVSAPISIRFDPSCGGFKVA